MNQSNSIIISKNVLIIEDEILIAHSIQLHLKKNGYQALVATNPEKAKQILIENQIDAVICDINLNSESDGITFIDKNIKNKVPVIYLTAYNDLSTIKRAEKTNPYSYLIKPFNKDQLVATLNMAFVNYKNQSKKESQSKGFNLTPREIEIAKLLAKGMKADEIAEELHISFNTIRTHRKNMLQKLDCSNTTELVVKCICNGLIKI